MLGGARVPLLPNTRATIVDHLQKVIFQQYLDFKDIFGPENIKKNYIFSTNIKLKTFYEYYKVTKMFLK